LLRNYPDSGLGKYFLVEKRFVYNAAYFPLSKANIFRKFKSKVLNINTPSQDLDQVDGMVYELYSN